MKLHLGCGKHRWDGYINCDLAGSDHDCDIRILPFEDGSAKEIVAIHVLEHFPVWEVGHILREWKRVLSPGGKLVLELPSFDKVIELVKEGERRDRYVTFALYGNPAYKDEYMMHKWCYSHKQMRQLFDAVGFSSYAEEEPLFHFAKRDMRWVAVK